MTTVLADAILKINEAGEVHVQDWGWAIIIVFAILVLFLR